MQGSRLHPAHPCAMHRSHLLPQSITHSITHCITHSPSPALLVCLRREPHRLHRPGQLAPPRCQHGVRRPHRPHQRDTEGVGEGGGAGATARAGLGPIAAELGGEREGTCAPQHPQLAAQATHVWLPTTTHARLSTTTMHARPLTCCARRVRAGSTRSAARGRSPTTPAAADMAARATDAGDEGEERRERRASSWGEERRGEGYRGQERRGERHGEKERGEAWYGEEEREGGRRPRWGSGRGGAADGIG